MGSGSSSQSARRQSECQTPSSLEKEKQDDVKHSTAASLAHQSSQDHKELMISYSHADREMMMRIKGFSFEVFFNCLNIDKSLSVWPFMFCCPVVS